MSTTPPNPYGSCFDAAAHNFIANHNLPGLTMCHGVGTANRQGQEGMRIAHAWMEINHPEYGKIAFDPIWMVWQKADLYRANLKAYHVVEYGVSEFMYRWKRCGTPGPFDSYIKRFTSDSKILA